MYGGGGGGGGGWGGEGGEMTRNSEYICILVLRSLYDTSAGQAAMVWLVRPWPYQFLREKKWHHLDLNLHVHYGIAVCRSLGRLTYDN